VTLFDESALAGKSALILGTGPGIGASVAKAFARSGETLFWLSEI